MLRVVHAVAGAVVDLHFADAPGEHAMLARVAECQPIDSCQHPEPCLLVAQGREPILEIPGLPDLDHVGIVFVFGLGLL